MLEHAARHTGLGVIAITDHDPIAVAMEARALAKEYGFVEVVVDKEFRRPPGAWTERDRGPEREDASYVMWS
jgi:hypothetical protein